MSVFMSSSPKTPPVSKPIALNLTAPAAYKPQSASAQLKPAMPFRVETRPAPSVYRPEQIQVAVAQTKSRLPVQRTGGAPGARLVSQRNVQPKIAASSRVETRPAPPVFRPQQSGAQAKGRASSQVGSKWPLVYKPVGYAGPSAGRGNVISHPNRNSMVAGSQSWPPASRQKPFQSSLAGSYAQMQPQAVSGASVPNVRPTPASWRGSNSQTVQPMIVLAKKDNVDPLGDYAVLKVLHQLVEHQSKLGQPTAIQDLVDADFKDVKAGETLYIVGHGFSDDGNIADSRLSRKQLFAKFNKIKNKIGGIVILTCYGGYDYNGRALVDDIKDELTVSGIPVTGMNGFSYGSTETLTSGRNSVLPKNLSNVYSGTDLKALIVELGNVTVQTGTWNTFWNKFLVQGKTLGEQLSDKELALGAEEFMKRRDELENWMKAVVSNVKGKDIDTKVANLQNSIFHEAVSKQYDLFTQFALFDTTNPYKTVTS